MRSLSSFPLVVSAVATLLGTDQATVRKVLASWGPGKFDAELFLAGKAFNPQPAIDHEGLPNQRTTQLVAQQAGTGSTNFVVHPRFSS